MVNRLVEALTKGSSKILQNKNLVTDLADAIRYDVEDNPTFFPRGAVNTFPRMQDSQLAEWFLSELDRMESDGYDGSKLTSDGSINDWLVKKYILGAHNWEDITGKLQQQVHNWVQLKKYNLLKPEHMNIPSFNSIQDLGKYMVGHYSDELVGVEDRVKQAAMRRKSKSIKLVDNDEYRIFVTLNKIANQLIGANTTWCTTSAGKGSTHWDLYSNQGMLFQLFPNDPEEVSYTRGHGRVISGAERYQFGPDTSYSFMNIADDRVPPKDISSRFPYLWDDLKTSLQQNASKMEAAMETMSKDPNMQDSDSKVKVYNIQSEIAKLSHFVKMGYFTNEQRPLALPDDQVSQQPIAQTESIDHLMFEMMLEGAIGPIDDNLSQLDNIQNAVSKVRQHSPEKLDDIYLSKLIDELACRGYGSPEDVADMLTHVNLKECAVSSAHTRQKVSTIKESFNYKEANMTAIDKDVEAMLTSLKKYDKLTESVLGMTTVGMARNKRITSDKPWEYSKDEKHAEDAFSANRAQKRYDADEAWAKSKGNPKEVDEAQRHAKETGKKYSDQTGQYKGGKNYDELAAKKMCSDLTKKSEKSEKVSEGVDQDILDWMDRFSKLGNMKGYGR